MSWPGWGTFRIEPDGGPSVVIDPCLTPLMHDPVATPLEVVADVVLLTHGHHEHIIDAHRVGRLLPTAPFVAPPQVVEHLVVARGMRRQRFDAIEPDGVLNLPGLTVTARAFPHLPKNDVAGKLTILGRHHALGAAWILARHGRRVVTSWLAIRGQPEQGPFLAYDLDFEAGPRVFVTCEAFTELLDPKEAERWGRGERQIDLAIVGVESGRERVAGQLLDRLAPRRAIAAAVHAPFERFYGRPAVDPTGFVSSVQCTFQAPGWSARLET